MRGNGRSFIRIPELLTMVAQELDVKHRRELMLVSKRFFRYVGPTTWESVPKLDFVMRLIEGVTIEYHLTNYIHGPPSRRIVITLPSIIDLTRYNIYANWIRELELFDNDSQEVKNLDSFLTILGGRPPLPNLRRLSAYAFVPINSKEMMNLISIFINPSLETVRTIIHKRDKKGALWASSSRVPTLSVPIFLKRIKDICPKVSELEFYPEDTVSAISEGYKPSDQCHAALSSFLPLRSFSSTTYILEPATLGILAGLPHLESLGIRGSPNGSSVLDKQLSLPETWFPALKDLGLYNVHHEDVQVIWKQPTFVKRLTSVLIEIDHTATQSMSDSLTSDQNWCSFLAALGYINPQLQAVAFYVGVDGITVEIPRESWMSISKGQMDFHQAFSLELWSILYL